jgi:hypothetical protein
MRSCAQIPFRSRIKHAVRIRHQCAAQLKGRRHRKLNLISTDVWSAKVTGPDHKALVLRSGRGPRHGTEGFYSLAYTFQLAGAENVLMSLWKVDDEKTRTFMKMLYTRWAQQRVLSPDASPGQTLRHALRQTMLDAKKDPKAFKLRHYAAFVLLEN